MLAPGQAARQACRRVGLERQRVGRQQALAGNCLPAPATIDLIPLVGIIDALDAVLDRAAGDLGAQCVDGDDVEFGVDSLARIATLEHRTDADVEIAAADRNGLVGAGGAAAARLEDPGRDLGTQGQGRVLDLIAGPFELRLAGLVGFRRGQRDEGRLELVALALRSEAVLGERRERLVVDGDAQVGFDREA